ncbi:acyl-ACP--UDP-N-acetylglucosamine O-acyltransferase [Haliscomenobacter sp.]|uniref:acyl-ACP--UDP-N-acetylglucosamine O-acyltransferase n=1 Tax=Haliscomenobacter sp. TaxID=2717303 RepID=UPI0039B6F607
MNQLHLSSVHPDAKIGSNVTISPFCFIDKDVVIGDNTWIGPNVTIFDGARIGSNVRIFPGAVISGIPQDLKFQGEVTTATIGDHSTIREFVTINRGTAAAGSTKVGKHCLVMAYAHIAHDCILGDHVILANNVNLAGHVQIDEWAILEGLVAVQQFTRIGAHSFIAGGSLVRKHVPPFVKAAREPLSYAGVNVIGLQRRNFSQEQINNIHEIYRILFVKGVRLTRAIEIIEEQVEPTLERSYILDFVRNKPEIMKGLRHINGSALTNEG